MARRHLAGWRPTVLLAASWAGPRCLAQSFREELLELARQRNGDFYRKPSNLVDQKSAEGVAFSLSRDSKDCAGDGTPLTFTEYDIESEGDVEVRPVDAFNVLSDPAAQPQWDPSNKKATFLGDFEERQARGFSAVFNAKPVSDRELYEWMMVDANFTSEEFWVLFTSLDSTALQQRKPADQGTTAMQNCMGATRITKTPKGLHIVSSNQPNAHPFPLDPRTVANLAWKTTVGFAVNVRRRTQEQAKLRWNATRTVAPAWMLEERPCGARAPDTEFKVEYLSHAARVLGVPESERGTMSSLALGGGGTLRLWESRSPCSAGGGSADTVPVWWASFRVQAKPVDVFNVLVNKSGEPTWNAPLARVNETGFSRGARGLHEEYSLVSMLAHRELWEWQAAAHNLTADPEGGTYLVAVASVANFTEKFAPGSVEAAQCMAAYQVAPDPDGGSIVGMTSQFDPKIFGDRWISKLWPSIGRGTIKDFAEGLINQSRWLATARARDAGGVQVDGGALALLAPAPPGRNASATLAGVLGAGNASARLRLFADLDLPRLLDASAWAPGAFHGRAAELLRVFELVRANATAAENATFSGGPAADAVAVQLQGLAMASVQGRVLDRLARQGCRGPALPDIDGDKPSGGLSLVWAAAAFAVVVALACAVCCLCCARWRKRRRERMARVAGAALLQGVGSSPSSALAAQAAKDTATSTTASMSSPHV